MKKKTEVPNTAIEYPFNSTFDKPYFCPKECGTLLRKSSMLNILYVVSQLDPNSILTNRPHKCAKLKEARKK